MNKYLEINVTVKNENEDQLTSTIAKGARDVGIKVPKKRSSLQEQLMFFETEVKHYNESQPSIERVQNEQGSYIGEEE